MYSNVVLKRYKTWDDRLKRVINQVINNDEKCIAMLCITVFLPPNNFFSLPIILSLICITINFIVMPPAHQKSALFLQMCLTVCLFLYFSPFSRLINFYVVARVAKIYCHAICTIIYISRVGIHYFSFLIARK